jgi:ribonuclease HII
MKFKLNLESLPAPFIGVDEVGRGCLAGPVVAGAVIFRSNKDILKYKDSKEISKETRQQLSVSIFEHHIVSLGWASVEEIDEINILQASFLAMKRAIIGLKVDGCYVTNGTILVDGRDRVPNLEGFEQRAIIKGDQKVRLISAASIVSKVARDNFMMKLALKHAEYGFEKHKGYGTPFHKQRIRTVGPCKWHRQSFSGVKEYISI